MDFKKTYLRVILCAVWPLNIIAIQRAIPRIYVNPKATVWTIRGNMKKSRFSSPKDNQSGTGSQTRAPSPLKKKKKKINVYNFSNSLEYLSNFATILTIGNTKYGLAPSASAEWNIGHDPSVAIWVIW